MDSAARRVPQSFSSPWTVDFNSAGMQWWVENFMQANSISKLWISPPESNRTIREDPTWANLVLYGKPHLRLCPSPHGEPV